MNDKKIISGPGTVVGANVNLVGTIHDANEIIVHGHVEGEVVSQKSINITETALVKGPVTAELIQVAGQINGAVTAAGKLEIMPTGKIFGSITTKNLSIHPGAIFVGKSTMPGAEKYESLEEEPKAKEEEIYQDK